MMMFLLCCSSTLGERVSNEIGRFMRRSPPGNNCPLGGALAIPGTPSPQFLEKRESSICIEWNVRARVPQLLMGCQVFFVYWTCDIVHIKSWC